MAKVVLSNLRKEFGKTVAVEGLSIEVPDGGFISILGPSGCGKTTTLNMIAGLLPPTTGDIYIGEKRVTDLTPKEREVGLVFQDYAVFPTMTGYENIAFGLKLKKMPDHEIDREVKRIADLLDITDVMHKNPRSMNQSELQRVAVGRTLVTKPAILLLDEPLSNLDAAFRARMRAELKRLCLDFHQTVIYVTHDQIEAMSLSNKIAVMSMGRLQQLASPEDIYHKPLNRFVAGFIGSPPMNFVDCTYEEHDGKAYLNQGTFKLDITKFKDLIQSQATGSELVLGARPEDIHVHEKAAGKQAIEATVYAFEPQGSESIVDLQLGKSIVRALVSGFIPLEPGEKRFVEFDLNKVHILDKKTEKAII
ncbi:MAG: ABC transporter ATP-binding protein [Candidatus Bathyarchaeia archaeon]